MKSSKKRTRTRTRTRRSSKKSKGGFFGLFSKKKNNKKNSKKNNEPKVKMAFDDGCFEFHRSMVLPLDEKACALYCLEKSDDKKSLKKNFISTNFYENKKKVVKKCPSRKLMWTKNKKKQIGSKSKCYVSGTRKVNCY